MSKCVFPNCNSNAYLNDMCVQHNKLYGGQKKKEVKPIAKESKKRAVLNRQYRKMVSDDLSNDPLCKVKAPGCTVYAGGEHHIQKRTADNLTRKENLIPCCNHCNLFIELNQKWAESNGFWISRFAKV